MPRFFCRLIFSGCAVTDFPDLTNTDPDGNIRMEQMPIHLPSKLIDVALQDSNIRKDLDLFIVAVRKPEDEMLFNPSSQTRFQGGDTVVAIEEKGNLEKSEVILSPEG